MSDSAWLASLRDNLAFIRRRLLVGIEAMGPDDLDFRPVPRLMSPREQILHVVHAERTWRSRCTGEAVPAQADAPAGRSRDELVAMLAAERARTVSWLEGLTAADLTQPIQDGRGRELSVIWVINHLARHDAHHAGQIILLWRLQHPDEAIPSGYSLILDRLGA